MFEAGFITLVLGDPTVTGMIGNRLYALNLPETAALPAATYQVISGTSDWSMDGTPLRTKRVQMDFWGNSLKDAKLIEQAVTQVIDGFTGTLSDGTRVLHCFRGLTIDRFEMNSRFYRVMNEFAVTYVD